VTTSTGSRWLVFVLCLAMAVIVGLVTGILEALNGMSVPGVVLAAGGAAGGALVLAMAVAEWLRG
jgi:hypothetical protein